MSSLKKSVPKRTYKERSQPAARSKLGFLEKHKDYVLRARDFHSKEKRIKKLKEKAAARNPDEFYFAMVNARTNDGVHVAQRREAGKSHDIGTLKKYKVQDGGYLSYHEAVNRKKIERLESELQLAIPREDNEDDGPLPVPKKLVFVDDEAEVGSVARRLLAADRKKRARTETEAEEEDSKKPSREQRELAARKERADKLRQMNQEADLQKALMGKGAKKKVGNRYVWKQERKR